MAESNKKGMISGMDSLLSISGEEYLEVIRLESDGSYKNYKLLVSKIRNNAGLSAYEIALQNGFVGTVDEWLASLEGKSAYQIAVDLGFVGDEAAFIASLKGDKGEDGSEGKSIYDIALENGFVGTEADFLKTLVGKSAYQTALDNGFVGTEAEWLLSIKGEKGEDGEQGEIGPDGKSAYEVWLALPGNAGKPESEYLESLKGVTGDSVYESAVANGFVGTEVEWLATLVGKSAYDIAKELNPELSDESEFIKSLEGKTAFEVAEANGFVGTEAEWLKSLEGKTAYEIAVTNGFIGTESQWLASLEGSDGINGTDGADGKSAYDTYKELPGNEDKTEAEFIESLKGDKGEDGINGVDGTDGESAYQTWLTLPGNAGKTEAEFIASIKGDKGEDGIDGTDGQSAYEVAVANGFVGTVNQWEESLVGPQGEMGKGINVIDTISQEEFDQIVSDGTSQPGDAYIVTEFIYIFNGTEWIKSNSMVGPAGQGLNYLGQWPDNTPLPTGSNYKAGDTYVWKNNGVTSLYTLVIQLDEEGQEISRSWVDIGIPGPKGDSAYQTWLKQPGNTGKTEAEFIESLKGEQGEKGEDGTNGLDGADGKSAYEVAVDNGFIGTVEQWEASLKGDKGEDGEKGDPALAFEIKGRLTEESELPTPGVPTEAYYVGKNLFVWLADDAKWENFGSLNGDSAYQTWLEQPGNEGKTEEEFLESLKGQSTYALWLTLPGNDGKTEQEFLNSLKGRDGIDGVNGSDGRGLNVLGTQPDLAAIELLPDPTEQDAWVAEDTGHLHIYVGVEWIDAGKFRGDDGTNGVDGKSAFETYKELPGNADKTEAEFIESLKGVDGTDGTDGRNVIITGTVADRAELDAIVDPAEQDAYTVQDVGNLFMMIGGVWTDLGRFRGDKGEQGDEGLRGLTGLGLNIVGEYDTLAERPDPATLESGDAVFVKENHRLYQVNLMGTYNVGVLIEGPQGEQGEQGEKGEQGAGINIEGVYPTLPELQTARPNGPQVPGQGYLVGTHLYIWIPSTPGAGDESWVDAGEIRGPRGEQGIRGLTGLKGNAGEKGDRGSLWLRLEVETPSPAYGTEGDWAINDTLDVFYKTSPTEWVPFGKLTPGDVWSPALSLGRVVRLGTEWVALPIDEIAAPEDGVVYVRMLKSGSTTETEWVALSGFVKDLTSAQKGDKQYVRVFEAAASAPAWKEFVPGISEAPVTAGKTYLRSGELKNWVEFSGLTPPTDAKKYLRTNNAWVAMDSYDLGYTAPAAATAITFNLATQQMIEVANTLVGTVTINMTNPPALGRCTTAVVVVKGNTTTDIRFSIGGVAHEVKWNGGIPPTYTAGYNVLALLVYQTSAGNVVIGSCGSQTPTL